MSWQPEFSWLSESQHFDMLGHLPVQVDRSICGEYASRPTVVTENRG